LAWDCATGTGQAALDLATRFGQVVATDISAELLAQAPTRTNVTYRQCPAEASGLAPGSVDLITVAQAIHWFDLVPFWREVDRVLKPGGVLAFWCYTWPEVEPAIDAALEALKQTIAPFWPEKVAPVHNGYVDLTMPYPELPHPAFVIRQSWTREDFLAHLSSWSAVRYHREKTGRDAVADHNSIFSAVWPGTLSKTVSWSLHLKVCRKP